MNRTNRLQHLVSAVAKEPGKLVETMQLDADAVIINQSDHYAWEEWQKGDCVFRAFTTNERGVGLSRNQALLRADHEICLFSDEDIVYSEGYVERILQAFDDHPKADMLLFNVEVCENRRTYHIDKFHRVRQYNCGRYPAYSFAIRTEVLQKKNITYSLLFGGGAKYSNGEDSLFIRDCIGSGMKVYAVPVSIGREEERESTWFSGYHEKFFFDRGVLYHFLYGKMAMPLALRFLLAHREMCRDIPLGQAFNMMRKGISEAKK